MENEDGFIHVNFTMTKVPTNPTPRPQQISIPHPFTSSNFDSRVCIIVKDPEEYFRDQIQDMKIPCIAEVIGFDRLKRDFHQYKDKRQLSKDYDLFLADIRIYKMLPVLLGKEFYAKKSYPCPIKVHGLEKKELESQLNKAASDSYYSMGNGPNYSCKVGRVS